MAVINKKVIEERVANLQTQLPFEGKNGGQIIKVKISDDYLEIILIFSDGTQEKLPTNLFLLSTN